MTPDPLASLLRTADLAAPIHPPAAPTLRTRAARRRRRTSALAAALCALAALPFLPHTTPAPPPIAKAPPPPVPAAADIHARIATETAILLAQRRATGQFLNHDPAFVRDAAAQTLVLAADRRRATDPQNAARTYATAAALFPNTPWGSRAAATLAQLQ
jgi:hypothetical protein